MTIRLRQGLLWISLLSAPVLADVPAATSQAAGDAFQVEASDSWVATPFQVESGKVYHLTANGTWTGSTGQACGPEGSCPDGVYSVLGPQPGISEDERHQYFINQNPRDALVARIGRAKWTFCVGKEITFQAPQSGELFLRINDSDVASSTRTGKMDVRFSEVPAENVHWADKDGTVTVRARIDVSDFLHFTPDGLYWEWGGSWGRPGEQEGHYPTIINGISLWPRWQTKKETARLQSKELWPGDASKMKLIGFWSRRGTVSVDNRSASEFVLHFKKTEGFGAQEIAATVNVLGKEVAMPAGIGASATASLGAEPPVNSASIEQPAYRNRPKQLVKSLASVNGLVVQDLGNGTEVGSTLTFIGVVPGDSRPSGESKVVFVRGGEGEHMKTSMEEAVRAVKLRFPKWASGQIEISFDDKYTPKDGGSGGTAFAVLMLSMLQGYDIDPAFALTGDITVDWKVRPVGGVPAKILGATAGKCTLVAIPVSNAEDVADLRIIAGDSALWNIQILSIETLQDAVALARTDRPATLAEALKTFADLEPQLAKGGKAALHVPAVRQGLEQVLKLAPNHLSASYLLKLADGTAPRTLSAGATVGYIQEIRLPYLKLLNGKEKINRNTLPAAVTASSRKKLFALRAICDKRFAPFLAEYSRYVDFMDDVATGHATASAIKERTEAIAEQFAALEAH